MQGFVYIWFNVETKMFYIGSHYGDVSDNYVGSGIYFLRAFRKNREVFRRRIIQVVVGTKRDVLDAEQAWLDLIPDNELGRRYYNLKKFAVGGSIKGRICRPRTPEQIAKMSKPKTNKENYKGSKSTLHRNNISKSLKNNPLLMGSRMERPTFTGITNDEFKSEYMAICSILGKQPSRAVFRDFFFSRTGKQFPKSLGSNRFNGGKDLFDYAESLGYQKSTKTFRLPERFKADLNF